MNERNVMVPLCMYLADSAPCGKTAAILTCPTEPDLLTRTYVAAQGKHPAGYDQEHVPLPIRELVPGPGVGGKVWKDREYCALHVDPVLAVLVQRGWPHEHATLYLSDPPASMSIAYAIEEAKIGLVVVCQSVKELPTTLRYLMDRGINVETFPPDSAQG